MTRSHIIEIALDDRRFKELRNPDACYRYVSELIVDSDMYYLLIDEVRLMEEFEDVLNGFLHIKNADVYVTGSNSKFLSSDIVTQFRGRSDEIHVRPLRFLEFLLFQETYIKDIVERNHIRNDAEEAISGLSSGCFRHRQGLAL